MKTIKLNHFALSKKLYEARLKDKFYAAAHPELGLIPLPNPSLEQLMECINKMDPKLQWFNQDKLKDKNAVREKLAAPTTILYYLVDQNEPEPIGFALVVKPAQTTKDRFFNAANDNSPQNIIEFDYLGLYQDKAGQGRGRKFFELLFARYFQDYDTIYWTQRSSNAPTLESFYRDKMGMQHLAQDEIPDFRL